MTHFSILNEHYARYMMLVRFDEAVGECRQHACCITKFSARVYLPPVQYVLFTTGAGAIDIICVTLQADLLDCQEAQRCSTDDTTGALKMSYIRQYVALSIELLGLLYSAYVFHALGFCQSHILPDEYGIPQHLCGLAKASITRKKLEARDPRLFDKGNTHVLFDPKDPLEIKWDTFTDTVLGKVSARTTFVATSKPLKVTVSFRRPYPIFCPRYADFCMVLLPAAYDFEWTE
ncbi:hypothetical protein TGARI_203505 [Toxoplasma gondii ARI]|uniref:Uncharacterized protein n=2 Tax=Toxoplasma gondii TaxID=5811 RepID=A0A2G8XX61_TOXGO|nr:hypothetical protein TGARI_203505 [Toxoplasma gondii ARI]PIL99607.1 hypothetical protein TGCOUG_203505 [Toxoplasma gondii COUG]